jgi:hypothetical protein
VPTTEELGRLESELPERAEVFVFVVAMVGIDGRSDHHKAVREAGVHVPTAHSGLDPPRGSILMV